MKKAAVFVFLFAFILLFSGLMVVNGELTWSDPINVYTEGRSPSLAVDSSGIVHIAWGSTFTNEFTSELWYANNTGGTFTPTRITYNSSSDGNPSLALDSLGNVHIVWEGNYSYDNTERDIYYINNVGGTFGSIVTVSDDDYDERNPQIAIDSNDKVHIVWQYNHSTFFDIRYANNTIGASDSFTVTNVTDNSVADDYPTIAIDSNDVVHIAWSGRVGMFYEVLYGNSSSPFPITNPVNVSQSVSPDDLNPSLSIDSDDNVHIAWKLDDHSGDSEIVYSNNIGGTFSSYEFITDNNIGDHSPSLVTDNYGVAHVLWYSAAPEKEVLYANNTDGNFATHQNVSRSSNTEKDPDLFIDSEGFLHAAWFADFQGVYYCSIDAIAPTIDNPDDITYLEGSTGNSITWHPEDDYPYMYNITMNGTLVEFGDWGGGAITIDLDFFDLTVGTYIFVCSVNDTSGNSASDSVTVTVTPPEEASEFLLSMVFVVLGVIGIAVVLIVVLAKHKQ